MFDLCKLSNQVFYQQKQDKCWIRTKLAKICNDTPKLSQSWALKL